jgi:hypothetical protein
VHILGRRINTEEIDNDVSSNHGTHEALLLQEKHTTDNLYLPHEVIPFFRHRRDVRSEEIAVQLIRTEEEGVKGHVPRYLRIESYE